MFSSLGKLLLLAGGVLAVAGLILVFADKLGFLKGLWERFPLGRLPGDIVYRREGFTFYFPWVTSIVISIVLMILFAIFRR